jgi:hypothetical protein
MMLGEEVQWDFVVKNLSSKPISIFYDTRGNYHNELNRDADLKIVLKDSKNRVVNQIDSKPHDIIMRSGRVGHEIIQKGQELRFPQWFNNWYKLEEAGSYIMEIEKTLFAHRWKEICKVKAPKTNVYFYKVNQEDRLANIQLLEDIYRKRKFKNSEDLSDTLEMIIRSASETSIGFYEELLNSKNSYNAGRAIRAIGKLSPNPKAFLTLVKYFDMGFVHSIDETLNPKMKESSLENHHISALYEIEKFPPEMSIYFLNKVIADSKYEGYVKDKAMQIISSFKMKK